MSVQAFHGVQQQTEKYFDMIQTNKKGFAPWARRLHLALLAYRELLQTIMAMDKSPDGTVRDSATVIKNNIFYVLEYRELILTLLMTYDELKMSEAYLKDLIETQHIFLKMFESFCGSNESIVVQKKSKRGGRKKKGKCVIEFSIVASFGGIIINHCWFILIILYVPYNKCLSHSVFARYCKQIILFLIDYFILYYGNA